LRRVPAKKTTRKPSKPSKSATARKRPSKPGKGAAAARKPAKVAPPAASSAVRSITPFLWFDNNFEEAARYYVALFPGSRIDGVNAMGGSFTLAGQKFMGLNGGPQYRFSPAVSFFVICRDQKEVDRLWSALEKGGKPSRCGWIDDRFGLTWQIIPEAFLRLTSDPNQRKVGAVFQAMMGMVKMDVKGLQAAYDAA
jgi:predicted 3-demethylubiquinone-9 3-methyltransferase (glyoxalase superfamily)